MSSLLVLDPSRIIRLLPGVCLVRIDEVLGGTTKGGIFVPPDVADARGGKDTASGTVLQMGPPPDLAHVDGPGKAGYERPGRTRKNRTGAGWDPLAFPVQVGDRVTFPRDLPLVFVHDEARYGFVYMDECIFATSANDTVEVLPSNQR